ncbi:MAG: ATP-dependent zinc metalloprotease FtsH [Porphyromonas sp.]|jgi:ATP-dependent zinc metalloprotease ftsH|nr:ATP-dependent zinc metalloprotease FtsH [Porphyromonas sp.]
MSEQKKEKKSFRFNEMWFYGLILIALAVLFLYDGNVSVNKDLSWNDFKRAATKQAFSEMTVDRGNNEVSAVIKRHMIDSVFSSADLKGVNGDKSKLVTVKSNIPSVDKFSDFYDQSGITAKLTYTQSQTGFWGYLLSFGPTLLLVGFWFWMMRRSMGGSGSGGLGGGGIFSVGQSKAKLHDKNSMSITFADVAGLHEAKEEVEEIVHFLKNPNKYTQLGAKIPKGALLVGPPGTGKTLLAKAVAGEAHVPFFSLSGSDFVEMFVGVGASRVRDLFAKAKEKAPCIVFIDEIDAVGRARSNSQNLGGNDERENTLNQLLTEMDGFGSNSGIIILAATNRVDILDGALTRAGRFDRQIFVDLPDINDRKEIFTVHLKNIKTDSSLDLDLLARQTPGFSGADIANICNEAALIAARNEKEFVSRADFMNAVDRIIGGLEKKNAITTSEERRSIAIHEAGHAVVSWFLEYANPLVKVTIVPRGKALGAAWYLPEERQITTTQALLDQMCATLAGRAAEEIFLGRISTGAANDLERITQLAYAMVVYYGMSDKLPNVNYSKIQGDAYGISKPYSNKTSELIDEEVNAIIAQQYQRAKDLLQENAEGHKALSDLLLEAEVIYTEDVERLLGKRQWTSRADEIKAANEERGNKLTEPESSTDSDNNEENCSLASDAEQL